MSIYEPGVMDLSNLAVGMVVRAAHLVREIPLYPGDPEIPGPGHCDVCYLEVTSIEEQRVRGILLDHRNSMQPSDVTLDIPRNLIEAIVRLVHPQ